MAETDDKQDFSSALVVVVVVLAVGFGAKMLFQKDPPTIESCESDRMYMVQQIRQYGDVPEEQWRMISNANIQSDTCKDNARAQLAKK